MKLTLIPPKNTINVLPAAQVFIAESANDVDPSLKPNILWIVDGDIGAELAFYGPGSTETPYVEQHVSGIALFRSL